MNTISKNIFVTGASGFIGKHLLIDLNREGYEFYVLTRSKSNNKLDKELKNVNYVVGDIARINECSSVLAFCGYFIHIAGEKKNELKMYEINVEGMVSILNEIIKHPQLKFIHISSSGIYGIESHKELALNELSECYPNNTYERTKYEAEKVLEDYSLKYNIKYTILRPSNVFGEFDDGKKLLNLFKSLRKGRFFYLDKSARVNYVYVKYLSAVINELIKRNDFTNNVYNLNSPCSIYEFIETIKQHLNINKKTITLPFIIRYFVYIIALVSDFLPRKLQFVNSTKYRELTNKKIYLIQNIKQIVPLNEKEILFIGLRNLISYYQKEGWL
jgi:nucleoside-diphosphate-sugar epimerase